MYSEVGERGDEEGQRKDKYDGCRVGGSKVTPDTDGPNGSFYEKDINNIVTDLQIIAPYRYIFYVQIKEALYLMTIIRLLNFH